MARYRVKGPDGAIHVFEGPDDATPEEVTAFAQKQFAPKPETATAAPTNQKEEAPQKSPSEMRQEMIAQEKGQFIAPFKGLSSGVGNIMFGAQEYLGKGAQLVGAQETGQAIIDDSARRRAQEQAKVAPYKEQFPIATGAGEIVGEVVATGPVGAVVAAPLKMAGVAKPLVEAISSAGFKTGITPTSISTRAIDLGVRGTGGAVTGGISAGLVNPDDVSTGATAGAIVPTVVAPVLKQFAKGLGFTKDVITGRAAEVRAAEIVRETLKDQLVPAAEALAKARPGITAIQALQEAGINADPFMALGKLAEKMDTKSAYRLLMESQELGQLNQLNTMAGGRTQTEISESLRANKNALNEVTTPMRETALQASNQADQTISRLAPLIAQKEASMVSALQGQGQAATNVAQQTNIARGGVLPATMGTPNYPNQFPSPIGGTGVPQPMAVATQAGLPRISPSATLNAERAAESGVVADTMGAIKAQRQAERDFLQRQMGSLEAYGLKPLDINPILNTIDSKLADPNLYGQTQLLNVLRGLRDDFTGAVSANGGVADARALYSMRKAGISQRIDEMYGGLDPSSKQKLTADVLASIKNPIDEAITAAGGTGWNRYLQTFETGMQKLDQQRLAGIALDKFKGDKEGFIKLVRGDDKDAVEKIFGYGSDNIFKEMGRKSGQLENIANQLERDIKIDNRAAAGAGGLARIMGMSEKEIGRIPAFFSVTATTINKALDVLEGRVSNEVKQIIVDGMKNGKTAAELIQKLPSRDRSVVLRTLMKSEQWNPAAVTVPAQFFVSRKNNLAPEQENRNNLRQ